MPTEGLSEGTLAFDLPTYGADLKRALDAAGLSYREAERVIGVDHNTLQRVASGTRPPNVEHYLLIERWLAARAEGPAPPGGGVDELLRAAGECRQTARELRAGGGCNAQEQAIMWDRKAEAFAARASHALEVALTKGADRG